MLNWHTKWWGKTENQRPFWEYTELERFFQSKIRGCLFDNSKRKKDNRYYLIWKIWKLKLTLRI